MKIGLINNLYKPYQKGGAERIVELLHQELSDLGHDVFVISTKGKNHKDNEEKYTYYLPSVYSELVQHSLVYRFFWQLFNLLNIKKYNQINKIFEIEKPDLVITNNLMGLGLLTVKAISKNKIKHLHIIHDIQLLHPSGLIYYGQEKIIHSFFAKIYQGFNRIFFNKNIQIISPSKWLLNTHLSCGLFTNNNQAVIPNPLPSVQKECFKNNKSRFIFIGQLEYHKGVDLFIKAAKRFLDHEFIVVGDGSLKDKISNETNLKVVGKKSNSEILELLQESAAVIVPSRCYENSPTVIYEAASTSTPAIAANLGGIPELVNMFGGLLFEPDNIDSLVLSIEEFLEHGATTKLPEEKITYSQKIINLL